MRAGINFLSQDMLNNHRNGSGWLSVIAARTAIRHSIFDEDERPDPGEVPG